MFFFRFSVWAFATFWEIYNVRLPERALFGYLEIFSVLLYPRGLTNFEKIFQSRFTGPLLTLSSELPALARWDTSSPLRTLEIIILWRTYLYKLKSKTRISFSTPPQNFGTKNRPKMTQIWTNFESDFTNTNFFFFTNLRKKLYET